MQFSLTAGPMPKYPSISSTSTYLTVRRKKDFHQSNASTEQSPLLRPDTNETPSVNKHAATAHESVIDISVWQRFVDFDCKLRVFAIVYCFFVTGLNVTDIGALLIQIEDFYGITDSTAGLIFVANVSGSLTGIFLLPFVLSRYGWRGLVILSCAAQLLAISVIATAPTFPIFLLALFVTGIGVGSLDAACCAWASKVQYASIVQGFMHGSFSVGSILGPIICVAVIKSGYGWYGYHRLLVPLLIIQLMFVTIAFRGQGGQRYRETHAEDEVAGKSASRTRIVYMCGLFYFFYLPVEASFTNWFPAYMRRIRHVDTATASYASSSFWTGMAVGRFVLGPVTEYFGLGISVVAYILLATLFQVLFHVISHVGLSLILLGGTGFFLAPMYPSAIILIGRKLSMHDYVGGVAAAAAIGSIGGAASMYMIGFMSEKLGLGHLVDVVLCLSLILLVTWILFARA